MAPNHLVAGIDVGGTSVKLGLFSGPIAVCEEVIASRKTIDVSSAIVTELASMLPEGDVIDAVGVGIAGVVGPNDSLDLAPNLDLDFDDLADQLTSVYPGIPVVFTNDVNAALTGELWQGNARGCESAALIAVGTGVGGAVAVLGEVVNGVHGAAGEIGHVKVDRTSDARSCGCGGRGCLECYISGPSLAELASRQLETTDEESMLRTVGELTAREVFEASRAGDRVAVEQARMFSERLATALAQMAMTLDPEVLLIGGGVSASFSLFEDQLKEAYRSQVPACIRETPIRHCALGNLAGMYGAAHLAYRVLGR